MNSAFTGMRLSRLLHELQAVRALRAYSRCQGLASGATRCLAAGRSPRGGPWSPIREVARHIASWTIGKVALYC
jgi:hypothetical protein